MLEIHKIYQRAMVFLQDYQHVHGSTVHPTKQSAQAIRWNPPIYSHLKINFDGATFNNLGAVGLRVVMCNSIGYVIGAMCENVSLPTSSVVVEALACRRVLVFAKELCVLECSVEGDVEVIINAS